MSGAEEQPRYVLNSAELQAVQRLNALITRCYEIKRPGKKVPLFWRVLYSCVLQLWHNESTVGITTFCWYLDREFSTFSGETIPFKTRPSSDGGYQISGGSLRGILDRIRSTSSEDVEDVRSIFFQALWFPVDFQFFRRLAGLPPRKEECEQASNNRIKMEDTLPTPSTSQTLQNPEVAPKRQLDGGSSSRNKRPCGVLETTAKSHESAMLEGTPSCTQPTHPPHPSQPTQPTQTLKKSPDSDRSDLLAHGNQRDNTQSDARAQEGTLQEANHDIEQCRLTCQGYKDRLVATEANIEELQRNEDHLFRCGLAWRKERDELRDRLAKLT